MKTFKFYFHNEPKLFNFAVIKIGADFLKMLKNCILNNI
mgnify:FL=1